MIKILMFTLLAYTTGCTSNKVQIDPIPVVVIDDQSQDQIPIDDLSDQSPAVMPQGTAVHDMTSSMTFIDLNKIPLPTTLSSSTVKIKIIDKDLPQNVEGAFRLVCKYSHFNFDDSIVFPNQPGASHLHMYFNNTSADNTLLPENIRTRGNSTCEGGIANRSAYWTPAIIDTGIDGKKGQPIIPFELWVYYKEGHTLPKPHDVSVLPTGLRMIAGDSKAIKPQNGRIVNYSCKSRASIAYKEMPNCIGPDQLNTTIMFPECWDGVNLDSPDHRSHLAYPIRINVSTNTYSCPTTHPVILPKVSFHYHYKIPLGQDTSHFRLASDMYDPALPGGYSLHADWMNGWDPAIMKTWTDYCLNGNRNCAGGQMSRTQKLF